MRFSRATEDKGEIVREVFANFKHDVSSVDWRRYEHIMRKTRISHIREKN